MSSDRPRFYRKVLTIRADDSPNVRYAERERAEGREPSGRVVIPGVIPYDEYRKRRETWSEARQCIGLDARFWEGADELLFPPHWLAVAEAAARVIDACHRAGSTDPRYAADWSPFLQGLKVPNLPRRATGIGCDPAEGGDSTTMCAVDDYGVIDLESTKTPDTSKIRGSLVAFCKRHMGPFPDYRKVCVDTGGGGKQIADELRNTGHDVRVVGFGEAVTPPPRRSPVGYGEAADVKEDKYTYKNRRAEMYGDASVRCDPASWAAYTPRRTPFAIPTTTPALVELVRQLSLMPRRYDGEGRVYLPPKHKKTADDEGETLDKIVGRSPDEADAFVLAVHAAKGVNRPRAGGMPTR